MTDQQSAPRPVCRAILVLVATAAAAFLFAQPMPSLNEANKLFAEHSYQLALDKYEALLSANPSPTEGREAVFMAARARQELGRWEDANKGFTKVIEQDGHDIWGGRADWRLAVGLVRCCAWDRNTSATILKHVHDADDI